MVSEDIIKAVSENIFISFGGEIPIYDNKVKQGFKTPCFFIEQKEAEVKRYLGGRYFLKQKMEISYYPKGETLDERKLFESLEYIVTDEGILRGKNGKIEKKDDKLVLSIEYGAFFVKEDDAPLMEVLVEDEKGK